MDTIQVQGAAIPVLGLGTWQIRGQEGRRVMERALAMGYRHIDTAQMYQNEEQVGAAVGASGLDRDKMFITTKLLRANLREEDVTSSFYESLERLKMDYVDLLLIHWPNPSVPIPETIEAMNKLHDEGLVRHIGVSNFSVQQVQNAREASSIPIVTDQVEYHPLAEQQEILSYCIEEEMALTAYSPLAKGRAARNSTLKRVGQRHGKTPAQVALRWLIQQGPVVVIPKASSPEHLAENMEIFDFKLSPQEMDEVFELQGGVVERLRLLLGL